MTGDSRKPAAEKAESTNHHWEELKALFDSAILLDPPDREFFIESECGPNQNLRRELESLLLAYEETGDFLEQPAASIKSFADTVFPVTGSTVPPDSESENATPGSRIGAYLLEREIGRGGMGAVFLATRADGEFNKRVAIKLIRKGRENEFAIRRFRHERQILARLENQYVARLIDGGSTENGSPYFVMEYVEGKPVTDFCDERELNTRERLELFLKICSAVQYAHERNIIHRDLKPGNILVKQDGTPKLLDFGIAKILGADAPSQSSEATVAGFRMLTPAYASPEQMRGDGATMRSDVYSLGVILYELLCGERPSLSTFQRSHSGEGSAGNAHLSASLRAVVFHAIQWDPAERYASVKAFASDLQRYLVGEPPQIDSSESGHIDTTPSQISIAILPFRFLDNKNNENAFLALGITDALVSRLSRMDRLSVRPTSSTLKYGNQNNTAKAANELKVKYILEGSLHVVDECVRVSVQLVYSEASVAVWAAQFDESANDLMKLEDSLAEQVALALVPHLTGEEREQIVKSGTANGKAHESYLRGRWHWNRSAGIPEELTKALVCFKQAVAEDPLYARAHAGVADYYLRLGLWGGLPPSESFAAAVDAAEQAVRLDPSLGEAHASLGFALWAYKRDYAAAEQHFNLAIIRNPDYGSAHHWFGLLNSAQNQPELAVANLERACKVEPNSPVIVAALGFVHYNARQYEKAIKLLLQAARELRNSAVVQEMLAWCYLASGSLTQALETAKRSVELSERSAFALAVLAHAEAAVGNRDGTLALLHEIEDLARKQYVSGYYRASALLAVGDVPGAIRYLEQAYADRDWWTCWIAVEPRWDPLRNNPRFKKLLNVVQPVPASETKNETAAFIARRKWIAIAAAVLLACVLAVVAGFIIRQGQRNRQFENLKITKLTSNGTANAAAISPDGKYVAYTVLDNGSISLLLRDLTAGRTTTVIGRIKGSVSGLDFTRNGQAISFVNYESGHPSDRHLLVESLSGGNPQQVLGSFSAGGALTKDGSKAATLERVDDRDEMWIHDLQTGAKRLLKTYKYPQRFAWDCMPAWSSDGHTIAYALEDRDDKGFLVRIRLIDTSTGAVKNVRSPRWQEVQRMGWTGDDSALAIVGQERDSSFQQIWYLSLDGGRIRRIGNDLDNYTSVSVAANVAEMASVQIQTVSNIYVLDPADVTHPAQITPGSGRYFDLSWAPDGKILYASDATGSADLWMMNADGSGERQITSSVGRSYAPVMSPDGKVVAFHSNRSGNWQIWRVDSDGGNPKQLSQSSRDGNWPQFTLDSQFVLYHQTDVKNGSYNIWKSPVNGGAPVQMTTDLTMHPAVSPKDGKIAAWWSSTIKNPHWQLAIFSPEGGLPLRVFNPTADTYPDTTVRWTPAGDAISYLDHANGVANIWVQPVNGGAPHRLTSFTSGNIYAFDWSKNGKLLYSRGLTTADVVLIKNTNESEANVR